MPASPGTTPTPPPATPPPATPPPLPATLPVIGSPCAGVVVRGEAPETEYLTFLGPESSILKATLVIEWEKRSTGATFDWTGPYYDDAPDPGTRWRTPVLEVNVAEWKIETTPTATVHELEFEWPGFRETRLRFRSGGGGCSTPVLVCDVGGCAFQP